MNNGKHEEDIKMIQAAQKKFERDTKKYKIKLWSYVAIDSVVIILLLLVVVLALTSGCATHPDKISAAYVSGAQYQGYDCSQLEAERARIAREKQALYDAMAKKRSADNAKMTAGLILFWPALFFVDGEDASENSKLAQLMGDLGAIEQVKIVKKCGV